MKFFRISALSRQSQRPWMVLWTLLMSLGLWTQTVSAQDYSGSQDRYSGDDGSSQSSGTYDPNGYGQTGFGDGYYERNGGNPSDQEDLSLFYDALAPYGDWFFVPELGYVWYPYVDHRTWRPYVDNGSWVWTDMGWMWESRYEWGWAPFHYGRWTLLDDFYWVWVPDTVWGPAWVSWSYTDDGYLGWSPLPLGYYWYPDYGIDMYAPIPITYWNYVHVDYIVDVDVVIHIVPRAHIHRYHHHSHFPRAYHHMHYGTPYPMWVTVDWVNRYRRTPVRTVNVTITRSPTVVRGGHHGVTVYRPSFERTSRRVVASPPPPRRAPPAALRSLQAPPPPKRSGVAPSQNYRSRASYEQQKVAPRSRVQPAAPSAPRSAPAPYPSNSRSRTTYPGQAPPPVREERERQQDIRQEQRDVGREQQDVNRARQELRNSQQESRQEMRTNPTAPRTESRKEVKEDRKQLEQEKRDVRQEQRDVRQEKREAQDDRRESRSDRQESRTSRSSSR